MAKSDKVAAVAELEKQLEGSKGVVLTEYRGLSVKQLQELRRSLADNATYAVVKNRLTKVAAERAGIEGVDDLLTGPTAIAFVNGDPVEAAKGLKEFAKVNKALVIKGGLMDGKALSADQVDKIADLESREVILSRLAGAMQASLSQAASLFQAPLSQAARLVEARRSQLESQSGAPTSATSGDEN